MIEIELPLAPSSSKKGEEGAYDPEECIDAAHRVLNAIAKNDAAALDAALKLHYDAAEREESCAADEAEKE